MIGYHLKRGLTLLGQTAPFVLLNVLASVVMVILFLAYLGGTLWIFRSIRTSVRAPFIIGSVFLGWLFYRLVRSVLLYMVKAAHIAAMVGLLDGEDKARKQVFRYGFERVRQNVGSFFLTLGVDWLLRRIARGFHRVFLRFTRLFPFGGLFRQLEAPLRFFFSFSLGFIDELVWVYILRTPHGSVWTRAQKGLQYLAGGWRSLLGVASVLALINWGINLLIAVIATLIGMGFNIIGTLFIVLVLGFLVLLRWGIFEPFALSVMLSGYHTVLVEGSVDETTTGYLEQIPGYRQITALASGSSQ